LDRFERGDPAHGDDGIAGIAAHRKTAEAQESSETRKLWRVLLLLSAAATILMIRSSAVFWEHLPKLRFMQFPWRWMAILAVPYAYFLGAGVARRRRAWLRARPLLWLLAERLPFSSGVRGGIPKTSGLARSDCERPGF